MNNEKKFVGLYITVSTGDHVCKGYSLLEKKDYEQCVSIKVMKYINFI